METITLRSEKQDLRQPNSLWLMSLSGIALVGFLAGCATMERPPGAIRDGFVFNNLLAVSDQLNLQDNGVGGGFVGFDGRHLRIGSHTGGGSGTAWLKERQSVGDGYTTTFTYSVSDSDAAGGANGFAFIVQNHRSTALGAGAAGFGVAGLPKQLVVEFDSWEDLQEEGHDHIEVRSSARSAFSPFCCRLEAAAAPDYRSLGENYWSRPRTATVTVTYDPGEPIGSLTVLHPDTRDLVVKIEDLNALLDLEDGTAWIGFGASTGASYQRTQIQTWSFKSLRL